MRVGANKGMVGEQYQHLCATKYNLADWPKVNSGEETKEKLFVCSVATPLRQIRHRHISISFQKENHCYLNILRSLWILEALLPDKVSWPKILFFSFSVWKQILLGYQCWLLGNVFVVYLISSLNQTYVAINRALKGRHAEGIYILERATQSQTA